MINILLYPDKKEWANICKRPNSNKSDIETKVKEILEEVKKYGDAAVLRYTKMFDYPDTSSLQVSKEIIENSSTKVSDTFKKSVEIAIQNIEKFHRSQRQCATKIEIMPGIVCWRKQVPIEKVGFYIPGGTAPLFSTLIMLAIPAKIAGCKDIIVCTPPQKDGKIANEILYICHRFSIENVFSCGGAQAIGAMAYGTSTIPAVYKIFGPGNQYVTEAKLQVQKEGVSIDMPAGPSEVLIIADESANPSYIAADLLAQAEHGTDSQVFLISKSQAFCEKVQYEISQQLVTLPRREIAQQSLKHSKAIVFASDEDIIDFVNKYAPEHLIINVQNTTWFEERIINAGSVFIGEYTPESAGDYASGTNHVLPTNGYAKSYSGVSLDSFVKNITFQTITKTGLETLQNTITTMARLESLEAHARAVEIRLKK